MNNRASQTLLAAVMVPLVIVNTTAGIIAAIWLFFLGQGWQVVAGFITALVGPWILGFAMLPSMLFAVPSVALLDKGKRGIGLALGALGLIYTLGVVSVWCVGISIHYLRAADVRTFYPLGLWSYAVATAPLGFMAGKDDSEATIMTLFFAEVALILFLLIVLVFRNLAPAYMAFAGTILIGLVVQLVAASQAARV